jgi:hypothetical protein
MVEAPEGTRRVEVDGVTVEKTFTPAEFSHPAFRLDVVSDREESVTVRVSDARPDGFAAEDLGFHHDYEDEPWTGYTDEGLVVELTLELLGHESVIYGLRTDDPEAAKAWLTEPEVDVDPGD